MPLKLEGSAGAILTRHSPISELNILLLHQAPLSLPLLRVKASWYIFRLIPSPGSGSNTIINQKKLQELPLSSFLLFFDLFCFLAAPMACRIS